MNIILKAFLINMILIGLVYAKAPDPLQQILDRLDKLENRISKVEKVNTPPPTIKSSSNNSKAITKKQTKKVLKPTNYKEGLIVELKPVRTSAELKNPPLNTMDAFIWNTADKITNGLLKEEEIQVTGTVGFEIKGFLKVDKDGLYTLKVSQKLTNKEMFSQFNIVGWIEGDKFIQSNGAADKEGNYTAVGTSQLTKGIYKIKLWVGYLSPQLNNNMLDIIDLKIKRPGELKFSSIKDMIYHKEK